MTYIFDGDIDKKNIREFTEFLSSFPETAITVYLKSEGGSAALGRVMRHEMEQHEGVTLIAYEFIASAAFDVFKYFKGERKMVFGTIGMHHRVVMSMMMDEAMEFPYGADSVKIKALKYYATNSDKSNDFLTEKELKRYNKGDDVYFSPKRMEKIFKGIEVIKWTKRAKN